MLPLVLEEPCRHFRSTLSLLYLSDPVAYSAGNMNELKAVSDASPDDFCPYPPAPGHPFWVTAILFSIILFVVFKLFKWAFERFAKQRLKYAFIENTMLTLAPFLLDAERAVMKFPFLGKRIIKLFFWVIQVRTLHHGSHILQSDPYLSSYRFYFFFACAPS